MTRVVHIETCEQCLWSVGSRGCRHPNALWDDEGIIRIKVFNDFPVIPDWCPLEQDGPDWRPPTITYLPASLPECLDGGRP